MVNGDVGAFDGGVALSQRMYTGRPRACDKARLAFLGARTDVQRRLRFDAATNVRSLVAAAFWRR